jgi:hypothetical protein
MPVPTSHERLTKRLSTLDDQITVLQVRLAAVHRRRGGQVEDLEQLLAALLGTRDVCREMLEEVERGERFK